MSVRIPSVKGEPSPWTIHTERLDEGVALRVSGENATKELLHVAQARRLAGRVLELVGASADVQYVAALAVSEFGANAIKHGDGMGELAIVYTPPLENGFEKVDISVINPTKLEEDRTPAMDMIGRLAVRPDEDDQTNETAEHGRGLIILNELTKGGVGQVTKPEQASQDRTEPSDSNSEPKIVVITHAELSRRHVKEQGWHRDHYDETA